MNKLLVNTPTGEQKIIAVGEGGGYFDPMRVIWDERVDGEMPEITLGGMVRSGDSLLFDQARMDEHILASRPAAPVTVTRRQARQALLLTKTPDGRSMLDIVPDLIAAIPDEEQRRLAQIEWEDSQVFERNRPLLISMAQALGFSEEQLDNLFIFAATL